MRAERAIARTIDIGLRRAPHPPMPTSCPSAARRPPPPRWRACRATVGGRRSSGGVGRSALDEGVPVLVGDPRQAQLEGEALLVAVAAAARPAGRCRSATAWRPGSRWGTWRRCRRRPRARARAAHRAGRRRGRSHRRAAPPRWPAPPCTPSPACGAAGRGGRGGSPRRARRGRPRGGRRWRRPTPRRGRRCRRARSRRRGSSRVRPPRPGRRTRRRRRRPLQQAWLTATSAACPSACSSLMSTPALKPRPSARSTTTRTHGVAARAGQRVRKLPPAGDRQGVHRGMVHHDLGDARAVDRGADRHQNTF